jgi:hypothetical protein
MFIIPQAISRRHINNNGYIAMMAKNSKYVQELHKIIETLTNLGIEFELATLQKLQSATINVFRLFTLCSARVTAVVILLSDIPCERIGKWETCSILKEDTSFLGA